MKQITRNEAEALFLTSQVVSSNIRQNKSEMCVIMRLTDDRAFLLKYNLQTRIKSYFYLESAKC